VAIAVRSNVVSRGADGLDQVRIPLRDPADDEEGRANTAAIQHLEQRASGWFYARGQPVPVLRREQTADAAHVKPLFEIDSEEVVRISAHADAQTSVSVRRISSRARS
jgi:hypothetical protein